LSSTTHREETAMTPTDPARTALLNAILPRVPFDGWSPPAFEAARKEVGLPRDHARTLCPDGARDLAVFYHRNGDAAMTAAMKSADLSSLRYSEKVAFAIRARLDANTDREAVRRASAMFALPQNAATGMKLIWGTADAIWEALGDTSRDANWYSKRATLGSVYAACVLYWLGDDSADGLATADFVDRRIEDVMRIETVKGKVADSVVLRPVTRPLGYLLSFVKAPTRIPEVDLPGRWTDPVPPD